ncbi:MAG: endonuclease domain-containing protein, partial [Bdellovibrionales bacterium]
MKAISEEMNTSSFIFQDFTFDRQSGALSLTYKTGDYLFEEVITFPNAPFTLKETQEKALENAFQLLHTLAGVSYYKAFVPELIQMSEQVRGLNAQQTAFFDEVYTHGLGEFATRNELDILDRIHFTAQDAHQPTPEEYDLTQRRLVLVGGGKDSLVSVQSLQGRKEDITLFAVNPAQPILNCIEKSGLASLIVKRALDPQLFELNASGKVYNGHVPITAIISAIATCAALLYDYDEIILSNERSANEATLIVEGKEINHQYSKSFDFEKNLNDYIQRFVHEMLSYYSLLRSLSEAHIARLFSRSTHYDDVFTSCNGAYKIHKDKIDGRWCGACPKCQFVYLMFATSMPKERLNNIVGANPLDQETFLDD